MKSHRRARANPIRKIRLKVVLEADEATLERAGKALGGSRKSAGKLMLVSQTSDLDQAVEKMARLGEAVRERSKDFK